MAKKATPKDTPVTAYHYNDHTRKNIPLAGLAAQGKIKDQPRIQYSYDSHLPPVLRFDQTGATDQLTEQANELLDKATREPLIPQERDFLAQALRARQPWLEWTSKREKATFGVDPVALHIHERVSAQAILRTAQREDIQRDLFADPQLDYAQATQFYQHDIEWANRLILGDSLQVMASLARREELAGWLFPEDIRRTTGQSSRESKSRKAKDWIHPIQFNRCVQDSPVYSAQHLAQ